MTAWGWGCLVCRGCEQKGERTHGCRQQCGDWEGREINGKEKNTIKFLKSIFYIKVKRLKINTKNFYHTNINQEKTRASKPAIFIFFLFVEVQLSPFSPKHSSPSQPSPPSTLNPTLLWLSACVLYTCSSTTLPTVLPIIPPHTFPRVIISLFLISRSLVIFCFLDYFVDKVSHIGEIIWYLSFTACLISLCIMLSKSIQVITKGRGSFFLFAE